MARFASTLGAKRAIHGGRALIGHVRRGLPQYRCCFRLILNEMVKQREETETGQTLENDSDQPVTLIEPEKTPKKCRC